MQLIKSTKPKDDISRPDLQKNNTAFLEISHNYQE